MRKSLLKVFSILVVSLMLILFTTSVNAADTNTGFNDISYTLSGNNTAGNNTAGNNTTGNNASNNSNTNLSNSLATNNSNSANNSANSSVYNNTSLPKTGIGDTLPIAALVVVFGISAVYAYKKIKDYRNI